MINNQIKLIFFIICLTLFSYTVNSQVIDNGQVFSDDVIPKVEIIIPEDSLVWILDNSNLESNYHFHVTFIFDNGNISDTLQNVGFRLRGNTSRFADKKSFKISFNTYAPGRKYKGLEKMNINGEHNDPSIIRSKLGWDITRQLGLVGSRSNHVRLYINNEYYGLYINVEHIDEEFVDKRYGNNDGNLYKCLWPADLQYLGSDPDEYKLVLFGRRVYELKTNTSEDDYTKLAHFIDVLNNTPFADKECELEQIFNVDDYLKYIAFDILIANWDGPIYNKNNFYLYENPANGLIEYIPYDIDNSFGIDWFGIDWSDRYIYNWSHSSEPRPLFTKILQVPEYRKRFTFYLTQILQDVYKASNLFPHIDSIKLKMDPWVEIDPFAPLDYGYNFDNYNDSFDEPLWGHIKFGVKEFITERYFSAIAQWNLQNIKPIIKNIKNNFPNSNQDIVVTASVEDDTEVVTVELHYELDNQNLAVAEMFDDGNHEDGEANDGIFGVVIPALNNNAIVDYFINAIDDTGLENRQPTCITKKVFIGNSTLPLYVNEIMAKNKTIFADSEGEYDDWIEIYNGGNNAIYLGDKFLSDNIETPNKWQMPNIDIQPGEFLVFWTDNDEGQGDNHTNFKLSADGEFIGIFDAESNNFAMIDGENFGEMESDESLSRLPNGTGFFEISNPTPGASNEPLSFDDLNKELDINVFPNPANEFLNIVFKNKNKNNLPWQVEIMNQLGRVIYRKENIQDDNISISLNEKERSTGIYFIKIKTEDGDFWTGKIFFE